MSSYLNLDGEFKVESDKCHYKKDAIISDFKYVSLILFDISWFIFSLIMLFMCVCVCVFAEWGIYAATI